MREIRCTQCSKLLLKASKEYEAAIEGHEIEIKCTKCKCINKYKAK